MEPTLEEKTRLIKELHAQNLPVAKMARKLGITESKFYVWQAECGLVRKAKPRTGYKSEPVDLSSNKDALREQIAMLKAENAQLRKMNKSLALCVIETTSFE